MKKLWMAVIISLLAVLLIGTASFAVSAETEGEYTYLKSTSDGTVTITDVKDTISGDVIIPSILDGGTVTSISDNAFADCVGITSVTIPEGVTNIGLSAFGNCTALTTVNFNAVNCETMGFYDPRFATYHPAFAGCTALTTLNIGNRVESLPTYAFYGCNGLKTITIPNNVKSMDASVFYNCTALTSATIGNGMTSVGESVFEGCTALKSVTIGKGLTNIPSYMFYNCVSLESITIPDGVTSIGWNVFSGCNALKEITVGNGIKSFDPHVFSGCTNLEKITIPFVGQKADGTGYTNFGYIFGASSGSEPHKKNKTCVPKTLQEVVVTGSGTVAANAFYGCSGITGVSFIGDLTSIGGWAFGECTGLKKIALPKTCTEIQSMAFYNCGQLSEVFYRGTEAQREAITIGTGNKPLKESATWHCNNCIGMAEHKFTNGCDTICNVCNLKRTAKHTYTNSCDTVCNICKAKRTIKHTYSHGCDKTCNVCGATRTTSHSYVKKVTKATLKANGKIYNECKVCGYVASKTTAIRRPYSFKLSTTAYTYNGAVKTPSVTVKDTAGKVLKKGTDYTVTYASGRKNAGTYKVTVKMKGNYSGTKELTFKINPIAISKCKLSLSATSYTYDGKVKAPTVTVKNAGGTKLTKNTHYTVTYASGRKNVGTYKVTVKMKGNYSGTKELTFKINPVKTTVSKLTPATKALKVSITKKSTQVTGYQIQYATSKSFSSPKTVNISSYKTTSTTIKSLKAKTTYYVRVRTYKTVSGVKYYSGWSTYKYAKTK